MKIIVCIKAVRGDYVSGDIKDQTSFVINPYDLLALQTVINKRIKEKDQVVCLSMGGPNIKDALVKSIAIGVDDVYWLCDSNFAGADTIATSYVLAESIKKIGEGDLIVCGGKTVDGETGQVGIGISERLGIPCITNVDDIIRLDDKSIVVKCINDREQTVVKADFPVMVILRKFTTVTSNMSLLALKSAQRKKMNVWGADTIKLDKEKCGIRGSKTQVLEVVSDLHKKNVCMVEGEVSDKVKFLDELLLKRSVLYNG